MEWLQVSELNLLVPHLYTCAPPSLLLLHLSTSCLGYLITDLLISPILHLHPPTQLKMPIIDAELDRQILLWMFEAPGTISEDKHGEVAVRLGLKWNTFRYVKFDISFPLLPPCNTREQRLATSLSLLSLSSPPQVEYACSYQYASH